MPDSKHIEADHDMNSLAPYFSLGLDLNRAQNEEAEEPWQIDQDLRDVQIPEHLETLIDDFSSGLNTGDCDDGLIRPRLDAILMVLLAKVLKENRDRRDDVEAPESESTCSSDRPSAIYLTPCWTINQKLTLPPVTDSAAHAVGITVDFLLLYGPRPTLDTNVVVLRKRTILPDEGWGVLAAMYFKVVDFGNSAAIHRERKTLGANGDIYGVHTDTYTWNFFHLNDTGKYSTKLNLSWNLDQQEVIGRICQIIRDARTLSQEVGGRDPMLGLLESETEHNSDDEMSDHSSLYEEKR
ncbi:hypothetical protein AbraIFM66950_007322 [Aspergillus brasiliensis]|nr:hypothetical protein AbraIFM66950_007322 [Aspergillus brasiliensis]